MLQVLARPGTDPAAGPPSPGLSCTSRCERRRDVGTTSKRRRYRTAAGRGGPRAIDPAAPDAGAPGAVAADTADVTRARARARSRYMASFWLAAPFAPSRSNAPRGETTEPPPPPSPSLTLFTLLLTSEATTASQGAREMKRAAKIARK